jgi:EpsG family
MIYYIIILLLFVSSLLAQIPLQQKQQQGLKYSLIAVIVIIGAFRYQVGYDWFSYKSFYDGIDTLDDVFESREERFFVIFLYLTKLLISNYSFFIGVFFLVTFYYKLKAIQKLSVDVFFSLFVYTTTVFLIYDLNGIRQGMALSLTLYAVIFVYQRRLVWFLLTIAIASLFHTSAVIFLPFYWLSRTRFRKTSYLVIFMVICLLLSLPFKAYILSNPLFQYFLNLESLLHYGFYLEEGAEINRSISIFSIATLQRIVIWSFFIYNVEKIKCDERLKTLLLNGYSIAVILFVFLSFSAEFSARLSYYYKILEIIIIPLIISSQARRSNRVILLIFFSTLLFLGISRLLSAEHNGLLPYNIYPFFSS